MPRASSLPVQYKKKQSDVVVYQPQRSGGFGEMVKQGFALGTGQAFAHHIIGSVARSFASPAEDCSAYQKCLTKFEKETCDTLYETCAAKRSTP